LNFDTYITPVILTFVFQTNAGEASDFLSAFVFTWTFAANLACLLSIAALLWLTIRYGAKRIEQASWVKYFVLFMFCGTIALYSFKFSRTALSRQYPYTVVTRFVNSMSNYSKVLEADRMICTDTGIVESDITSPVVVVVIGESYNKHHSSLYGYKRRTNPCLEQYRDSSQLYVFEDVRCPYNHTNSMLKELFSLHSMDSPKGWNEYPMFCQILKDGGYYVSFISNQVSAVSDDYWSDFGSYFFQYPEVASRSFDYRNVDLYKYDEGVLKEVDKISSAARRYEFTMLHLNGQHIYAKTRFPQEQWTQFTLEDYIEDRRDLNDSHLQRVADYDNATLYNDYVVAQIIKRYEDKETILIYLSDHGEEIYDYRTFMGRAHGEVPTSQEIKYQYQVPFMIYVSKMYKDRHPEIVRRIEEAVRRPFMTDDLSHLVLGISGIKTRWYEPERDLLSDQFNESRERIIGKQ
jgi:heptose-I-phosphate ethanolaminephosphotransferase